MRRTKQVEVMIERANEYLKNNYVYDVEDDCFWMACEMLIHAGVYKGYITCEEHGLKYFKIL